MFRRVKAASLMLALTATLIIPPRADAVPPAHQSGSETGTFLVTDCGDFDLYDDYVLEWNSTLHFDKLGTPIRVVEHVWGSDTFRNSVTGESVPGTTNAGEIVDLAHGNVTQNGNTARITVPGVGVVFFDVGKFIIDIETGDVEFLAGAHHGWFEEDYAALCEVLG